MTCILLILTHTAPIFGGWGTWPTRSCRCTVEILLNFEGICSLAICTGSGQNFFSWGHGVLYMLVRRPYTPSISEKDFFYPRYANIYSSRPLLHLFLPHVCTFFMSRWPTYSTYWNHAIMLRSGQFLGQKGLGPLEKSLELSHYEFCPLKKKIISRTFQISGTLIVIPKFNFPFIISFCFTFYLSPSFSYFPPNDLH
jgi:hypothetical protein